MANVGRPPMAHKMKLVPLIVMVPVDIKAVIRNQAKARKITMGELVREILAGRLV